MKILCVSDQIDPLIYNHNAKKNFPDIDLILCAGDLPMDYIEYIVSVFNKPTYFVFGNHNLKEFKYYHGIKQRVSSPFDPFVTFNSIDNSINHGATYAGFKVIKNKNLPILHNNRITPLLIAGISGSIKYNNGLNQYTDTQMKLRILLMLPKLILNKILYGRYLDIFLTHATPYKVHDHDDPCHTVFSSFNWFVERFKPKYMVHGHIHLYDQREIRISQYKETTIVNAFAHCIIDFEETYKKYSTFESNKIITE